MDEVKQTGKAERDFNYSIWYSTPSWSWTGIIRFSCGSENLFYLSYLCLMSQQSQKWICEFVMDCFYMQNIKKKSVFQEKMWSCDIVNPPMIPALIVPAWLNKGETLVSKAMCGVGVYCVQHRWEHYIMKNMFSLVSTYISWSSLSLPTPRMRKTSDSCMVSAAHPLVTRRSYRLFRFSSFHYVTKGVIYIDRPPLHDDKRYLSSVCPAVRWQGFAMSSLRGRHANCSVVCCKNQHQCLYRIESNRIELLYWSQTGKFC